MLISSVFAGTFGRDRPSAARVPRVVDKRVAQKAMIMLFCTAPRQFKLVKKSSYHFSE